MATRILPEFVCSRGHRWQVGGEPGGTGSRCPACGGGPVSVEPPLRGGGDGPPGPSLAHESIGAATLSDYLRGAPLPYATAAEIVEALAHEVHEAHRQGLRHGHLTAARVVLEPSDPPRFVDPESHRLHEENSRELIPRIAGFVRVGSSGGRRDRDASVRADVQGLGMILFELLTGVTLHGHEFDRESASPCGWNPKVPGDLEAICLACLEPDPARRLADAGLVAGALRQFLDTFVTQFPCSRCTKAIKSRKPLRVGTTVVHCPHCGEQTVVEPFAGKAPATASHDPVPPRAEPAPHASSRPQENRGTYRAWDAPDPGRDVAFAAPAEPDVAPHGSPLPVTPRITPTASQPPGLPMVAGYVLLSELGRGGMGVVYKAKHEKLKRLVALKMVSMSPEGGPHELAMFQGEAEAVARLHHPNIVQIYEVGEQEGTPYLALEFVTGGTLRARLGRRRQPIRAAVQLVQQIARAMHAAHQRGIVHRDLKPANILLQPAQVADNRRWASAGAIEADQEYGVPKITDFGVAKWTDEIDAPETYGDVVGTPAYMAPEQARGTGEEIGPAADIYSLGVMLYEMLTGRPPFVSKSITELLRQVLNDPPAPPRQLRRELPRDLEAICLRCLEKDPRRRYPTAMALADDLGAFLEGEPVVARRPGPAERVWNWSLKNPIPSTLLLTITTVLLFGQWSLHRLADRMVEATTREDAAQQTELIKTVNSLYTEVAARAKSAGVEVSPRYPELEGSIPLPARFTIELGQRMQARAEAAGHEQGLDQTFLQLRLYSDHPFRKRSDSPPKYEFGKEALDFYRDPEHAGQAFERIEKTRVGVRVLRYATPMVMEERCLKCHNDPKLYELEEFRKTDWKVGDVRGVLEVVCPIESNTEHTQNALLYTYLQVAIAGGTVLALSSAGLVIGRRRRHA